MKSKSNKSPKGKFLNGSELASYIQERHARTVRSLGFSPKLVIVRTLDKPEIATYVRLKQQNGKEIGIEVVDELCSSTQLIEKIEFYSGADDVDGVIVQLPLKDEGQTDEALSHISPEKDVDALNSTSFDPATPTAILWLLAGYNINLPGKKIAVIGQGRLVGKPLSDMLEASGLAVTRCDINTEDLQAVVEVHDVIVSAVGKPNLIKSEWIQPGAIVVDAGTSSDKGELMGDVEASARERKDVVITPLKGGVGPLTIAALFENVILSAKRAEGLA